MKSVNSISILLCYLSLISFIIYVMYAFLIDVTILNSKVMSYILSMAAMAIIVEWVTG